MPTMLSEEVTSIHPMKLLAQARQLWKIGTVPALLSKIVPLLNWGREDLFRKFKCQGKKFLLSGDVISRENLLRRRGGEISLCTGSVIAEDLGGQLTCAKMTPELNTSNAV